MGEITEMILEGILCEQCGAWIDEEFSGSPRKCDHCIEDSIQHFRKIPGEYLRK
jgi:hypothetical protein